MNKNYLDVLNTDLIESIAKNLKKIQTYFLFKATNNNELINIYFYDIKGSNNCCVCGIDLEINKNIYFNNFYETGFHKICSKNCMDKVCDYGC
jgi:hypothetical protein|tara:strand:- start:503 stop:781 length:279 start_codon:yes stop_codon:yes gene_type:complete